MSKILLADDSETMGKIIHIILRNHQVTLEQSYQSQETLAFLDSKCYDLLILSSSLKGLHTLQELKKLNEQIKTPPILLLTSSHTEKEQIDYHKEGFPFILDKPFTKKELILKIEECGLKLENLKQAKKISRQEKKSLQKEEEELDFHSYNTSQDNTKPQLKNSEEELSFQPEKLKDLETRITESLCNPQSTFFKVIQHMVKEEMETHALSLMKKQYKDELKNLIAEHLRGELKTLSHKKKETSSSL